MAEGGPDLVSLVLRLRPLRPAPAPPPLGRAAHALLLAALTDQDPALSEAAHKGDGPRPLTASSLLGPRRQGLSPEHDYALRFTALQPDLARALLAAAEAGRLAPGQRLVLAEVPLQVEGAARAPEEHPWAAQTTYEALSAPWLLARQSPGRRLRLRFTSPTTFRTRGMHLPLPLPELVFGSLLNRWNAFAPVRLPEGVRRFAAECLAITRYRLQSRAAPVKEGGVRVGAVGWVEYLALNPDRYWLSLIHLLGGFTLYAGVGAGTTMGLGQARLEPPGGPAD